MRAATLAGWLAGWGALGAGGGRLCFPVSGGQREAKCSSGQRGACLRPRAKATLLGTHPSIKVYNFTAVEILTSILK